MDQKLYGKRKNMFTDKYIEDDSEIGDVPKALEFTKKEQLMMKME